MLLSDGIAVLEDVGNLNKGKYTHGAAHLPTTSNSLPCDSFNTGLVPKSVRFTGFIDGLANFLTLCCRGVDALATLFF